MCGQFELVAYLEVAPAEHGRVHGQQNGLVAGLFGAVDQFEAVCALLEEVELQHIGVVAAGLGDVFERAGAEGGQAHDYALGSAGASGCNFTVRVRKALHGSWGDAEGGAVRVAEDTDRGVDLGYVAQHAGTDAVFRIGGHVLGEGCAGVSSLVVIVACLFVHAFVGEALEFGDCEAVEVVWAWLL